MNSTSMATPSPPDLFELRDMVRESFTGVGGLPLFSTGIKNVLWEAFLSALPEEVRQVHNCHACRAFVRTYGDLVYILPDGTTQSAFWRPTVVAPEAEGAVTRARTLVEKARVTGLFVGTGTRWGLPENHDAKRDRNWTHMSVEATHRAHFALAERGANVRMGNARTDHEVLARTLADLEGHPDAVLTAIEMLKGGQLPRPEALLPRTEWLEEIRVARKEQKDPRLRHNLIWRAAASAPAGWCNVPSSVLGTFLDDIIAKRPFAAIKVRLAEKLDPLEYRRPKAPVSAGNVKSATTYDIDRWD